MDNKNNSAFPAIKRQINENMSEVFADGGLTKREYAAISAMNGLLQMVSLTPDKFLVNDSWLDTKFLAQQATKIADDLLSELNKPQNNQI